MSHDDFLPLSGREMPRFGGLKTFFRLPYKSNPTQWSKADAVVFGVPFDGGVSYRPGARFAPSKVREVSSLGRGYHMSRNEFLFQDFKVCDIGDCSVVPMSVEKTYGLIENHDAGILDRNKKFLSVGGDHSTTLAHLRALRKSVGVPLALIHFDAHLDTYPAAWGCEYHHGAFVRHAINEGLIDPRLSIQFGIRGPLAGAEDLDFNKSHGLKFITVEDVREKGINFALDQVPKIDNTPTFLSFDVDCLDPSYAPGTGTPVPGGLTTYEVQKLLQGLKAPSLVAGDVVEVSPPYDSSDITALAAIDVAFEILCLLKASKKASLKKSSSHVG